MNRKVCNRAGTVYLATEILFFTFSVLGIGSSLGFGINLLISQLIVLIPGLIFVLTDKRSLYEKIGLKKISAGDVLLCILYAILMKRVLEMVNLMSLFFTQNRTTANMIEMMQEIPAWAGIAMVGIMPAVGEELVFRGVLYNTFKKVNPLLAVITSSVLFGILHGNLNQFLYAVVGGVMFVLIVEATGSVLASGIAHCLVDLSAIILVYLLTVVMDSATLAEYIAELESQLDNETLMADLPSTVLWGIFSLIGAIALAIFIARKNGRLENLRHAFSTKKESQCELLTDGRIFNGPVIAGIVIGIFYMILVEMALRMTA